LYINYKLQSVEHMPQRTLFYKFLNTIIDDLFSFIIKMPTMHRISCFRDDVIFVVYLYQRYTYRVDKTRGMYATERLPAAIGASIKEKKAVEPSDTTEETQTVVSEVDKNQTIASEDITKESKKDR
jgi:hypothetical protein